jgi:hypothetical protein
MPHTGLCGVLAYGVYVVRQLGGVQMGVGVYPESHGGMMPQEPVDGL